MAQSNNKIECIIKWCAAFCILSIAGGILYYFCHFHCITSENRITWDIWYNYLSPIIAIANVGAFLGLTIAIYKGDEQRQKTHEHINIQNTILTKLQIIEQDLSQKEERLRGNSNNQDIYTIYISLYKHVYYFKSLPELAILTSRLKVRDDAKQVFDKIVEVREIFIKAYQDHKSENKEPTDDEKQDLAYHLNYLLAAIEELEMSIIQDISLSVEYPK